MKDKFKENFAIALPAAILSVVIVLVVSVMMLVAGTRIVHFVTTGALGASALIAGLYVLATKFSIGAYRLERITSFLNPWNDPQDSGWQVIQSHKAIGSGGLFGAGLRK